jgi:outer membrane biosynthesis protein TonB
MASNAGIFFAGVGTTFVILGAGFGAGLFMAKSALQDPTNYQARVTSPEPPAPVRVILPSTAEAAQTPHPPVQQVAAAPEPASPPQPQVQQMKEVRAAPVEKHTDKVDTRKAEVEERERRKRYAERKAKRLAA